MASINYAAREINVKIVYYGPGLSGKTTNLQVIHRKVPPEFKSDMVSLATETDRTLFFDFLPLDLGKIKGFSTKFQLYTVPGQVYYNATRKLVLRGVDGIVFVADSGQDKIEENLESFQNLEDNLAEYGYKRETIPTIIQYNKRDLPNALSIEEMHQHINKYNLPWSEAVANKGVGVFDSLKLIGKIVIDYLNKKYSRGGNTQRPASPAAAAPQRPMQQQPMRPPVPQGFQGNPQQLSPARPMPPPPPPPPPMRPVPPPAMFNQMGGQPSGNTMAQRSSPPPQQQYQGYPPQGGQQIVPPMQIPSPGRAPLQQRPQQTFQQPQSGYQPSAPVAAMQQQPRPQQPQMPMRQPMPPAAPPPMSHEYSDEISFETTSAPHAPASQPPVNQDEFYSYGSINLEPMDQQQMAPPPQQQFNPMYNQQQQQSVSDAGDFNISGKTDLDLEIERYQREIEDKQRRSRGMPAPSTPPQAQQQPQSYEQPSPHEDYEVYNMEAPSYNNGQMQQPLQQNTLGADEDDMFFTSVDRDRQKKPVKRPMNPRGPIQPPQQQDKGFLSKFFKKDMP